MKTLLLVTHRAIDEVGGAAARWKAFARYLPEHGWNVEVIAATARASAVEYTADSQAQGRVATRARLMSGVGRVATPAGAVLGVKPEAFPPSMAWARAGSRELKERIGRADAVLATGPPMVALIAARMGIDEGTPFVAELRDLWAGSPAFDRRGGLLTRIERWIFSRANAIVVMTPEAQVDVAGRHPYAADRIRVIPNGFYPARRAIAALADARSAPHAGGAADASGRITLIHSGTITAGRPPQPLLDVLSREPYRSRFKLVLHGYVTPDVAGQLASADPNLVDVVPPSDWEDAIQRISEADAGVVLQGAAVGDATAVASKVFEYMVLGKPVLTVTDGGATEALLDRLGANQLAARISDANSIARALDQLIESPPAPPPPDALDRFDRARLAGEMASLLETIKRR
jgi:glycosyltransferase involved in cell wall biosynthesis